MKRVLSSPRSAFFAAVGAGVCLTVPWTSLFAAEGAAGHAAPLTLLWIAVILLLAKMSSLIERWGQPAVLGELAIGVLIGNLALVGISIFEPIKADHIIAFLAELGVIILLFQIGLETNIRRMREVGINALLVAVIGVAAPFILGTYVVGPLLLPGLEQTVYLFLGAALTATSVGITARVFKDVGALQSREAQIVLGAAVIDDVLGLIILAVVSAIVTVGVVTAGAVGLIFFKALAFLGGAIFLGQMFAPKISLLFSKISTGIGMKFTLAFSFGLVFAYLAGLIGLAPIVGAFAAGLVLDPVVFRYFRSPEAVEELQSALGEEADERVRTRVESVMRHQNTKHVEELIEPIAFFLVPIFFVHVGMQVDLATFADLPILLTALGLTAAAFIGKLVAGLAAGKGANKWIVGFGMVPRGEVGLIFATIGASLGVITGGVFSVIVIMVILTTLVTPPILSILLRRRAAAEMPAA
ncbi:cation:proton antiporter [Candidatus Kaiserbacteria bacterium CG10_big_fil_rev_8_21_14_0_10_59_10]|uniref:Cation:proton antiporter n=1 Tax=Candidatus Kaiserbacteria bacterium CG10_big_fil_rev_8_21_14_0_10_59_10 TaxID=1974612 RepID=A0A2H0U7H1_9BACT|nr:MAG: cation:proton antiporter [Candidatus Kaiserbacteria bacterium CG10_big_fil_rev_8_21_14_0_10_59_10]